MTAIEIKVIGKDIYVSRNEEKHNLSLSEGEKAAIHLIKGILEDEVGDFSNFSLERRSANYLSIVYCKDYDFIRLKIGTRSMWISFYFSTDDRHELANDKRFNKLKNKNVLHWKTNLASIDQLEEYSDLIIRSYHAALWSFAKSKNTSE